MRKREWPSATDRDRWSFCCVCKAIAAAPADCRDIVTMARQLTSKIREKLAGGGGVRVEELVDES